MRLEEFLLLFLDNWPLYILALLISGLLLFIVFNKYVESIIDPLFYQLIGALFANSVPFFLFFCEEIRFDLFLSFLLVEGAFWLGFITIRPKLKFQRFNVANNYRYTFPLFIFASLFVIGSQLYYYSVNGLPIFFESRIVKYNQESSGLGIFERLTYIMSPFCLIYSFAHFNSKFKKKRLFSRLFLCFSIFSFVAGGSKSAFLNLLGPLYFYKFFVAKTRTNRKQIILLGAGAIGVALLVTFLMSKKGETDSNLPSVLQLAYRVMMFGDCYYESYGNNVIDYVVIEHPIKDLLINLLAPFRLMPYGAGSDIAPSIQVHNIVYPDVTTYGGPNNRIALLYYCLFGWWAPIIAFLSGILISTLMFKHRLNDGLIGVSVYYALYQTCCSFITDPILGVGAIASFIFGFIFFKLSILALKKL